MNLASAVHEALAAAGITHALGGAIAMAVHGAPRSTADVDFLTTDPDALKPEIWSSLRTRATVDLRRGEFDDPLRGVVRVEAGDDQVDVVISRSAWIRPLLARATAATVLGTELPVVDVVGFLLLKLDAGSPKDRWDVLQLLEVRPDAEDLVRAVSAAVADLPSDVGSEWDRVLADLRPAR